MRDIRKELIEMLIAEVKPAVGCTEPVAVALACAKAKELLGEEIEENRILVSPSIYKNGMCVGIPGTDRLGLKIAVAMGFVGGHSENGLTVLETLSQDEVEESERYMDTQPINVVPAQTKDKDDIKSEDIDKLDAMFISGTSPKILPIAFVNNIKLDVNNITLRKLMKAYNELLEGKR